MDLFVADERAVHTNRETGATGHVQHVAHAQQGFGTHLVQYGAAVNFAADLKRQTRRNVGLDQASDHVHARALSGQDQMNAGGAGFLSQPGNQLFNFFAHHHHQVGQLVNHHHDVRQALQWLGLVRRQAERVANHLAPGFGVVDFDVVARQVAHAHLAHQLVALFHLGDAPVQAVRSLTHVGHHRA